MQSLPELISALPNTIELFARGGGGGSGGSSGGGGGGELIAMLGYVPAYYAAKFCNARMVPRWLGYILSAMAGLIAVAFIATYSIGIALIALIGAAVGVGAGMNNLHARIMGKVKQNRQKVQIAASKDPAWQEAAIMERVRQAFYDFQKDWSNFDVPHMQTYIAQPYLWHVYYIMKALSQMNRQNLVANPEIIDAVVADIYDGEHNSQDSFTVYIRARAQDSLIDSAKSNVIYMDNSPFEELWHFVRQENTWFLDGILQATQDAKFADASLEQFAAANNMYYSPDWGWLLLPQRGQLFGKANFKRSDVNNHVIGEWDGLLVQLYTYIPSKSDANSSNNLVGQITLPKSYGGIIIKRRRRLELFASAPRGYTKMSYEWPDFNKRYNVYATDMERVTSFELLNPAFMAELYDMDLPINIEVVDNVVYLYAPVKTGSQKYEDMMKVLQRAFRELKR